MEEIQLNTMLVVIICVEEYKSSDLLELPGTQTDKRRLLQFLSTARQQFIMNDEYDGVMTFYSGHGNKDHLTLSDYKKNKHGMDDGVYSRVKMEQYFNGNNIDDKKKIYKHKFFFIDSCRGDDDAILFRVKDHIIGSKGNERNIMKYIHPEMNRCIMYSNTDSYNSYEAPYNKWKGDIDWVKLADEEKYDKDGEMCGMFMNQVFHGFDYNRRKNFDVDFAKLQDKMREHATGEVPIIGDFQCKVGIEIDESGNLRNADKQRMMFGCSEKKIEWCMKPGNKMNFECL